MSVVVTRARILDARGQREDAWVHVRGDRIVATGTGQAPEAASMIDAGGAWLTPGFIDLHGHGGGGFSFDDGMPSMTEALALHRAHGTTRSVISLVANPLDKLVRALQEVAELAEHDPFVLGAHLEGPFLAPTRAGAHEPDHLRAPTPDAVRRLLQAARGTLRQVTLAPELPGALGAIDSFVAEGVVVAVGHTEATSQQAREAFDRGARLLTHAFNAMPGIHHREPGPVSAAWGDERVTIELILDGIHVHPDVARLAFVHAPGRVALITDAMAAAGSVDGDYELGTLQVTVADGVARLRGSGTIAGSTLTQDAALRYAVDVIGSSPLEAVTALTLTPARVLGIGRDHGLIAPSYVADLVLFEEDWRVRSVWGAGRRLA